MLKTCYYDADDICEKADVKNVRYNASNIIIPITTDKNTIVFLYALLIVLTLCSSLTLLMIFSILEKAVSPLTT